VAIATVSCIQIRPGRRFPNRHDTYKVCKDL